METLPACRSLSSVKIRARATLPLVRCAVARGQGPAMLTMVCAFAAVPHNSAISTDSRVTVVNRSTPTARTAQFAARATLRRATATVRAAKELVFATSAGPVHPVPLNAPAGRRTPATGTESAAIRQGSVYVFPTLRWASLPARRVIHATQRTRARIAP